ncbi:hypothetical protein [Streptomyces fradiae]
MPSPRSSWWIWPGSTPIEAYASPNAPYMAERIRVFAAMSRVPEAQASP